MDSRLLVAANDWPLALHSVAIPGHGTLSVILD